MTMPSARNESIPPRRPDAGRGLLAAGALAVGLALAVPADAHPAIERQIADLTRRIAAQPRDAALHLKRGELHRAHADWNRAAADYLKAREIDPGLDAVDLCMGRMLLDAGRPTRALASLHRFLVGHPDHPLALTYRGRALALLSRNAEAAQAFTRAIEQYRPPATPEPDLFLERARALAATAPEHLDEAIGGLDEGIAALGPVPALELDAIDLEMRLERHREMERIVNEPRVHTSAEREHLRRLRQLALAWGVSLNDLLGVDDQPAQRRLPKALEEFRMLSTFRQTLAEEARKSSRDPSRLEDEWLETLSRVLVGGRRPKTAADYLFIFEAIRRAIERR